MKSSVTEIIDISPVISERIGVFPGDTPFLRREILDYAAGHNLRLSAMETTVHLGAHADAPCHYKEQDSAADAASQGLAPYLGLCEVIHVVVPRGRRVGREDLPDGFSPSAPRILFATGTFPDPDNWNSDFASLEPELISWLSEVGVCLVGIDTPSVDPESSKDLPAHGAIAKADMRILEGLVLSHVPAGVYTLVALPLRIEGADASPVRAILLPPGSL